MSLSSRFFPALLGLVLCAGTAFAADKNPADYPVRLHIFSREEHTHFHHGVLDNVQGDGRANLFAGGEVHAVDFHFNCGARLERSIGYETYMAKWHKDGKQLTVLFPIFGQSGKYFTCDLDTDVKPDVAYFSHEKIINTEPVAEYKAWMAKRAYDPEQNKYPQAKADASDDAQ